jgi:hypothetical membrane protein
MSTSGTTKFGALCWVLAAPLFLAANAVIGLAWEHPRFSWMTNNISDLGNVRCGIWDTTRPRYVCSPWHDAMNCAFVLTALLLLAGFVLTRGALGDGRAVRVGRRMMLLWTFGLGMAGFFPADSHENLHFLAALLLFGPGNAGLVVAALARRETVLGRLRFVTLGFGLLGLTGSVLFLTQQGLGMGLGGMERVAGFALLLWACCVGIHLFTAQVRRAPPSASRRESKGLAIDRRVLGRGRRRPARDASGAQSAAAANGTGAAPDRAGRWPWAARSRGQRPRVGSRAVSAAAPPSWRAGVGSRAMTGTVTPAAA